MTPLHRFPLRVYYEDSDAQGRVYHANYLKFFERARSDLLCHWGFAPSELARIHDRMFVVTQVRLDFKAPAGLDDQLEVLTYSERFSSVRFDLRQEVQREQEKLVLAWLKLAVVNSRGRPAPLPPALLDRMKKAVS